MTSREDDDMPETVADDLSTPELDSMMQIIKSFLEHLEYTLGKDKYSATTFDIYNALSYAVRDRLVERWLDTQQAYYNEDPKRVYYVSMEFLMGRTLENSLVNLGMLDEYREAMETLGYDFAKVVEQEQDAGLGNGGLGRLAACFLDSMATMSIPAYGYGIRYEYGIFRQKIHDGAQLEIPDNWLRYANPWELDRQEHLHLVKFYGKVTTRLAPDGSSRFEWVDSEDVMAMAYDIPIPGFNTHTVNTLRLWSAKATREFDLNFFNEGNYIRAVEKKMMSENISKVLYPADHMLEGKELRLRQEYFISSATVQDIFYRFSKKHDDLGLLPTLLWHIRRYTDLTSIPVTARWYPARRLTPFRSVEPYVTVGVGPVFATDSTYAFDHDGECQHDEYTSTRIGTRFGGRVGGGVDFRLGHTFTLGVAGAWNWNTGVSNELWNGSRPNRGEFTVSLGWNFGR